MRPFRLAQINLDDDNEVTSAVAVIDEPYVEHVTKHAGGLRVLRTERGGTEVWAELTVRQIVAAHGACGRTAPEHADHVPNMLGTLGLIVYGLMEDD